MFQIFDLIFRNPTINLLVAFYQLFSSIHIPFAFGLSIIALSVIIKVLLIPFTATQIKSMSKMQKIAPHLKELKERHKGDNKKLQEETMKLYREHGVNPAGGCLPAIAQIVVTLGLYNALRLTVNISSLKDLAPINKILYFDFLKLHSLWDTTMFGLSLGMSPSKLFHEAPFIILVPILTGVFQFILAKMMMPEELLDAAETIAQKTKDKEDDFQVAFQKQSMFLLPAFIAFTSFSLPLGLSLYWNTFTIFGIIQQYILQGPGAARPWFEKAGVKRKTK